MNLSSDALIRWIDYALSKRAPARIPRSGAEGAAADCFSVTSSIDDVHYLLDRRDGNWLHCRRWNGEEFNDSSPLSIYDFWRGTPDIRHYIGHDEIKWTSWDAFAFDQTYRLIYLKLAAKRLLAFALNAYRSRKKVVTVERMSLLNTIFLEQLRSDEDEVGYLQIMRIAYGPSYFLHPRAAQAKARMRAILRGLVETGELKARDAFYSVTGKGMAALELFEEQERKHQDAMKLQRRMIWLTVILMTSAIVQAGLVKTPTLLKFDRWFWQVPKEAKTVDVMAARNRGPRNRGPRNRGQSAVSIARSSHQGLIPHANLSARLQAPV